MADIHTGVEEYQTHSRNIWFTKCEYQFKTKLTLAPNKDKQERCISLTVNASPAQGTNLRDYRTHLCVRQVNGEAELA